MSSNSYDFRQFQAELAALDKDKPKQTPAESASPPAPKAAPAKPAKLGKKAAAAEREARAREAFLALREQYELSVADVVAFFPEEEGIAYLQGLLAEAQSKPRRRRKAPPEA